MPYDDHAIEVFEGEGGALATGPHFQNGSLQSKKEPDQKEGQLDHAVLALINREMELGSNGERKTCPECRGTERYIGLNHVEACRECKGRGLIS